MTDPTRPSPQGQPQRAQEPQRRWALPTILAALIIAPIFILIFSNLDATQVSWAGFDFNQPLWLILVATFLAGMVGGKLFGWGWRRYRRRRQRLKEELAVLRKHASDGERSVRPDSSDD